MTNKHTAGEWFISNHNNELKVRARNTMMGTICTLNDIFEHEAEANAKLIAASPIMIDALIQAKKTLEMARKYMPKSIKNSDKFDFENAVAIIGSAIHKATK